MAGLALVILIEAQCISDWDSQERARPPQRGGGSPSRSESRIQSQLPFTGDGTRAMMAGLVLAIHALFAGAPAPIQ